MVINYADPCSVMDPNLLNSYNGFIYSNGSEPFNHYKVWTRVQAWAQPGVGANDHVFGTNLH